MHSLIFNDIFCKIFHSKVLFKIITSTSKLSPQTCSKANLGYKMKKYAGFLVFAAGIFWCTNSYSQQIGTIGVGDISYSADANQALMPVEKVLSTLNGKINSALIKTRKFTVLDYAQLKSRIEQQERTLEGYYAKQYTGNAVNLRGLDYILKADVTEFGLLAKQSSNSKNAVGSIDIDFELIGVADVTNDFSSNVSAQYSTRITAADTALDQDVIDQAIQQGVDQLVDRLISTLFPIRVMKIADDGAITLNYGEGLLDVGDTVLVFPKGSDIVIDESGNVIGDSVATLRIMSTERKFSLAQALKGQEALEKGQKGQLVLTGG